METKHTPGEKFTKEYAKHKAHERRVDETPLDLQEADQAKDYLDGFYAGYWKGYLRALEETNAEGLLEALRKVRNELASKDSYRKNGMVSMIDEAILKATK